MIRHYIHSAYSKILVDYFVVQFRNRVHNHSGRRSLPRQIYRAMSRLWNTSSVMVDLNLAAVILSFFGVSKVFGIVPDSQHYLIRYQLLPQGRVTAGLPFPAR